MVLVEYSCDAIMIFLKLSFHRMLLVYLHIRILGAALLETSLTRYKENLCALCLIVQY